MNKMGFSTSKITTFTLLTVVCVILLHIPATEGWLWATEEDEVTPTTEPDETIKSHTTLTPPGVSEHHKGEDPSLADENQHEGMKEKLAVPPASGDISVEQDTVDEDTGLFTTRKEGLVPHATDITEDGELDAKRETELDVEYIRVTTPKLKNKTHSNSGDEHSDHQITSKSQDAGSLDKPTIDTSPVLSKEIEDLEEDYSQEASIEETFMAVAGSGDSDEDLHKVTLSTAASVESEEESMRTEVTESIIVREEGSDLQAFPEKYTTAEGLSAEATEGYYATESHEELVEPYTEAITDIPHQKHESDASPVKDDHDTVNENTLETVTLSPGKGRRPRPRPRITLRPDLETIGTPKRRIAPGAGIELAEKPTTKKHGSHPHSSTEEPQTTTVAQEVIIDHRNSTKGGLSLAAKTGIAAGCVVAFWLILGPIVCCLCRMKDTPKEAPPEPEKGEGVNGALVENMVTAALAQGKDKKYNTTVENDQEITTLNHANHTDGTKDNVEV